MNWFKKIFHTCDYFRWEVGYGLTPYGIGRYEYRTCRDCGKIMPEIHNFTRDKEMYKEDHNVIK